MVWHEFALVAAAHFAAVASPGPDFAVVTKVSVKHGHRAGTATALGIASGILLHILYCLVGVALLIKSTPWLFNIVRFAGAAYLLWIAIKALQGAYKGYKSRKTSTEKHTEITKITDVKAWRQGFVTNITNPKATLFFLVIFTEAISRQTPLWTRGLYGTEMVLAAALWFCLIAWLINRRKFRAGYDKAAWVIDGLLGIVLLFLVLKIVL